MSLTVLSLLLMQAGPLVTGGAAPPIQPVPLPRVGRSQPGPADPPAAEPSRLDLCLDAVREDPLAAIAAAEEWLKVSKGAAAADPNHCLGMAYNALGRPVEAEIAFAAARAALPPPEQRRRASYGALAALAMLDQGEPDRAEAAFAAALAEAKATADPVLIGDIAIDRARAQVALKQDAAAAAGLAEGRSANPANPDGWLLSATLARRMNQLAEAQRLIERAADLAPRNPLVGLEAGVIAVLAGRDAAARKSWESVIAIAPGTALAETAQGYLAQLGPAPGTAPEGR